MIFKKLKICGFCVYLHVLCALFFVFPAHAWEPPPFPNAKIIAVEVWAQWCPNCKILDPVFQKARVEDKLDDLPILFVRLDYTDKSTINQAKMQGKLLGLEPFMKANGAGTGYVALLDAVTKEEIGRFTRETTVEEMIGMIQEKLAP